MQRLIFFSGMLFLTGVAVSAQNGTPPPSTPEAAGLHAVRTLPADRMPPADSALVTSETSAIATAAQFYGFDLSSGNWTRTQVLCPLAPGFLILHFHQLSNSGKDSLFTAIVPRDQSRVGIIPLRSGGIETARALGVSPAQHEWIEKVVPDHTRAGKQSTTSWELRAMCYAALAGAEPQQNDTSILHLSTTDVTRDIALSAQEAGGSRFTWEISFDRRGHFISIRVLATQTAPERPIPKGEQPKMRPIKPMTQ